MTHPNLSDIVKITIKNRSEELSKDLLESNTALEKLYPPGFFDQPKLPFWKCTLNNLKYKTGMRFLRWAKALGVDTYE